MKAPIVLPNDTSSEAIGKARPGYHVLAVPQCGNCRWKGDYPIGLCLGVVVQGTTPQTSYHPLYAVAGHVCELWEKRDDE